ncbi:MAG: ABC transporter permease [Terracidiphilus sp.]
MRMFLQDLRYALRQLHKNPGFTALAVGTLALGIAANSTVFSWINSTLLDPIPGVAHTSDMVTVMRGERSEHPTPPFSYADYADLRDQTHSYSGMLAYHDDYMAITGSGKPERIYGDLTSSNYFEVLGVRTVLGRTLLPTLANERAGAAEVVVGYDMWKNRFGGDPLIIGKTMQINLHPYTIVGVAPRGFRGCKSGLRADVWIPLGMDPQIWGSNRPNRRDTSWLQVLGKLKPGVTQHQADAELNLLMQRIADRYPEEHQGSNIISSDPLWRSPFGANVYLYGTLPILMALAAVLLLLACANVANLLLVRSVARRREMAIRLSMGATRWRVMRQLLVENLVIALAGGGAALALTIWTAKSLAAFLPPVTLPLSVNGHVNGLVFVATILVSILTAAVSGIVPALRASGLSPVSVLKDEALSTSGGLSKSRLSSTLVIAQVALSLLLLTCAGLFVRSLVNAQKSDPGFDPNHVLLISFDLDPMGYSDARGLEFDRQLVERVKQLPGVQSATLADFSPLSFTIHSEGILPEGFVPAPHQSVEADRGKVGPGYLQTMHTPLLAGRDFTEQDNAAAPPVAIVNQALVDRYWPGQNAIGKHIDVSSHPYTVVGVAANGKYRRMTYDAAPLVLLPLMQRYDSPVILHVRTSGDPLAQASAVQQTIQGLNPDLPVYNVTTLKANMQMGNVFERIAVTFAGAFGLLALLLAAVGIYGVVAYTTRQRTHEIGIRMALGAAKEDIFRQVLGQGLRLTVAGLAVGLVVSFAFTRFLRGMLFGIGTTDWLTFTSVAVLLSVVTLAACLIPARRAASIEPMQALRTE